MMVNAKHLCTALLVFSTSCVSIPALADVADQKDLERYERDFFIQKEKERLHNQEIENKQTPEMIERMKREYSVPAGPYHNFRGKIAEKINNDFWEEIQRKYPDFHTVLFYATINDSGDWFSCINIEKILKSGAKYWINAIKSSNGWILYSNEVGDKIYMPIMLQACRADGEIIE
ncbi:Hypothetical protein GbCGDNIH9_5065 [Granulibacter bethesdensis]|uniref:Secreted protein n=1 Tax=Granulibacter bethesdensis TaxID=364410 RepID=A0AAC9KBK4_9PROT|nr:hypothetical protein [Granulibacter bethesdensis]APH54849.1 Hypothetical protein GbCGDNIH9_5065 [Granulibacter bethesdensis]APH62435.1 Hypothetical protein GbCGDNIH8_7135 [Granulibacter bethesdensis]